MTDGTIPPLSFPGTSGAWRSGLARAPVAEPGRLIGDGALVVLSPHPDDETIGCSALLQAAARAGRPIAIVALTDGEGSHRGSAAYPPRRLAEIRRLEQEAAVERLGCRNVEWLRAALPDGASPHSPRLPELVLSIAALCERIGATAIAAPHPDDPHPDHHAASALAHAVRDRLPTLRLLNYEVWSRRLADADPFRGEGLRPFRLASDREAKRAALGEHASQLGLVVSDDAEGFALPRWFLDAMETETHEPVSWSDLAGEVPGPEHFARLYAEGGDPWHVRDSAYEVEKRQAAVELLAGRRYAQVLEAGCGEGHLTGALVQAGVAQRALGIDRDPSIVERASRMGFGPAARFAVGSLPDDWPEGPFDLVVFSEILYFLREADLQRLARNLRTRLSPDADLLLVSYKGPTGTPLGGLAASDFLVACLGEDLVSGARLDHEGYRMELLRYRRARVPAPAEGPPAPTVGDDAATGAD